LITGIFWIFWWKGVSFSYSKQDFQVALLGPQGDRCQYRRKNEQAYDIVGLMAKISKTLKRDLAKK